MLWFVGSSTIHKWITLDTDMQPWIAQNHGIDGALMGEVRERFGEDKDEERPRAMVFYAGENDIASGESAPVVIGQLGAFIAAKIAKFGNVPVFVISLKPSPTRWNNLPQQTAFNVAARRIAGRESNVVFVDVVPLLLVDGRPSPYYVEEGIHLNPAGYHLWASASAAHCTTSCPAAPRNGATRRAQP